MTLPLPPGEAERRDRERKVVGSREKQEEIRDIGEIPAIGNPDRRDECRLDLRKYLETYHPADFTLGWSDHHVLLIDSIQQAFLEELHQLIVFPRGSGKTAISRRSIQWGTLYGHVRYPMLFGAEMSKAKQHIEDIKKSFLSNDMLLEDFPEVIYPMRAAEGIANRANYQNYHGKLSGLRWGGSQLVFPDIDRTQAAGNAGTVIGVGTITGSSSRGPLVNGFRPDFAFVDDPQTRRSAKSPQQVQERIDIVNGDIMGMAGPNKSISCVMTATVIYNGDMADKMLDHVEHPEWNGIRIPMIISWPQNMEIWEKWNDIRQACLLDERSMQPAHDFYTENLEAMNAGHVVYWEDRIKPGYVSAIETAMALHFSDPVTFASEFQNQPIEDIGDDSRMPEKAVLLAKQNRFPRRKIPTDAKHLSAYIDVQGNLLYYMVMAFEPNFTGYVVDWGTWPDQRRRYYTLRDARKTIFTAKPGAGQAGAWEHAMHQLMDEIESREWLSSDGRKHELGIGIIDAGYGESTDTVFKVCEQRKGKWIPSFGRGHGAKKQPFSDFKKKEQDKWGPNWRVPSKWHTTRPCRWLLYETNFWKSFHAGHWSIPLGDPGAFSFWQGNHQIPVDHFHGEKMTMVVANDREVGEWSLKPTRPDNHLLDCGVGCCVGASFLGCEEPGLSTAQNRGQRRQKKKLTQDMVNTR